MLVKVKNLISILKKEHIWREDEQIAVQIWSKASIKKGASSLSIYLTKEEVEVLLFKLAVLDNSPLIISMAKDIVKNR